MHPAKQYIEDVLSGKLPACKWVKAACQRHLDDLKHGYERGLRFDEDAAQLVIDFFGLLKHSKGKWAGQIIELEPWQQFIVWVLFGWKRADHTRRFRTAYLEVARKNGKTTLAAGIGLYLMVADGEPGAEIYAAATKLDQAKILFNEAERMVKASPSLRKKIRSVVNNLSILDTATKFEPLGRDRNTMDGLNVHGGLIDELHAHPDGGVYGVIQTATGAREQPLMLSITTAGFSQTSFCYEQHRYVEQLLEGVLENDSYFGIIFALDRDEQTGEMEDWRNESVWIKPNPNLNISKYLENMRDKARVALDIPSELNEFLTKELNVWTNALTAWLSPSKWAACGGMVDGDGLRGRTCYGGLDLATTTDICAMALCFPPQADGDPYQLLMRFWVPQDAMLKRSRRDHVPYDAWVRQGYITAVPGEVIDYDYIYAQVDEDAQKYDIQEIAFDRWGATQVYQRLEDKRMTMVQFGQGYVSMSAPTKELEKLVLSRRLAHGGNPVLAWMASNVIIASDPAGNVKPDKGKSTEKIDGIVAAIMALDRATRHVPSVYSERGILEL